MNGVQTAIVTPTIPLVPAGVEIRTAVLGEAASIHALIEEHLAEGHLLPRALEEIALHINRFVVAVQDDEVIACGELAPLGRNVAEVRSLVVSCHARGSGVGSALVDELTRRASSLGYERLSAFTHAPTFFVQRGFSMVPHVWVPEKIVTDCHSCPQFRKCGQYAVVQSL